MWMLFNPQCVLLPWSYNLDCVYYVIPEWQIPAHLCAVHGCVENHLQASGKTLISGVKLHACIHLEKNEIGVGNKRETIRKLLTHPGNIWKLKQVRWCGAAHFERNAVRWQDSGNCFWTVSSLFLFTGTISTGYALVGFKCHKTAINGNI